MPSWGASAYGRNPHSRGSQDPQSLALFLPCESAVWLSRGWMPDRQDDPEQTLRGVAGNLFSLFRHAGYFPSGAPAEDISGFQCKVARRIGLFRGAWGGPALNLGCESPSSAASTRKISESGNGSSSSQSTCKAQFVHSLGVFNWSQRGAGRMPVNRRSCQHSSAMVTKKHPNSVTWGGCITREAPTLLKRADFVP